MTSLSVSAPLKPSSFIPSRSIPKKPFKLRNLLYKSSPPAVRALISSSSPPTKSSSHGGTVGLGLGFEETQGYSSSDGSSLYASSPYCTAPQTPATAMKGAEADVMGLLLRERIVFLGSGIDDFVADAIISQLLLLDAQDPTKDIRLFVNSPGGSLRYERCTFKLSNYG